MNNTAYYVVLPLKLGDKTNAVGGHGYSYDQGVIGKKSLCKDVPTGYGYFSDGPYQTNSVNILHYLTGRSVGFTDIETGFFNHLEEVMKYHFDNDGAKLLLTSNVPKLLNALVENKGKSEQFKRTYDLYIQHKNDIIVDHTFYPKGGIGFKLATDQCNYAVALADLGIAQLTFIEAQTEKEFSKPEIDFNKLISSSFNWFFNTGDRSTHYEETPDGRRGYFFGRPEKKKYYGKPTPDVCYSALFTKHPITVLDKLFEFCKSTKSNPLNYITAGNLNYILSKEVGRMIDKLPGVFQGNKLISPMKIATSDDPCIAEVLETGLGYRIKEFCAELCLTYKKFTERNTHQSDTVAFVDITDKFFVKENNKLKISPDFTQNTLKITVPVTSPHCIKPVKINLGVRYDTPSRNEFNALIKDKVKDVSVYLVLNFSNPAGCEYKLIVDTPEFTFVYTNACANKRVYSLAELGRS